MIKQKGIVLVMGNLKNGSIAAQKCAAIVAAGEASISPLIVASSDGTTGTLLISGAIGIGKNPIEPEAVVAEIQALKKDNDRVLVHLRNVLGGVIPGGFAIYNEMRAGDVPVDTLAEGVVASFGSVLFAAGENRTVAKHSRLMLHNGRGGAQGTADEMRAYADQIDGWNDEMVTAYSEVLGMSAEDVRSKWFDGKDHWLTASQAVKAGLATEQAGGVIKKLAPAAMLGGDFDAIAAFYNDQIKTEETQPKSEMNKGLFIVALAIANLKHGLTEQSEEAEILAQVTAQAEELKAANEELEKFRTEAAAAEEAAIVAVVDEAVKANKITAEDKPTYLALAKADLENTKAVLENMQAHTPITGNLNNGKGGAAPNAAFEGKTFKEVVAMDGGSKYLDGLMASDVEAYDKLKAAYDKLPTA